MERFEQWLEWSSPLEAVFPGKLQGECSGEFQYLDDHILAMYDVVFPDFPALPPLDVQEMDQSCQQVDAPTTKEQSSEEIIVLVEDDQKVDDAGGRSKIRAKSSWARNKSESDGLQFGDLQKYLDRPISEASKELKVGVTLLKKRCRELGIRRWPHRKLRSLKYLIHNVKEMELDQEIVAMLEEQRKMLVNQPEMELNDRAKKIRQMSFKANHTRRRKKMGVVCFNPN